VTRDDIRAAARLALPHRRRRSPFDAPGLDEALLDQILGDEEPDPPPLVDQADDSETDGGEQPPPEPDDVNGHADPADRTAQEQPVGSAEQAPPADGAEPEPQDQPAAGPAPALSTAGAGKTFRTRLFTVSGLGEGEPGRRSRAITSAGRTVGAGPMTGTSGPVHLTATVRAAAPHQVARGRSGPGLLVRHDDLRLSIKQGRESNLVLFCVDASGSMAARRRMEQVKTAVLSLLTDAYQRRDKVGLVTFRGSSADLALPPTSSVLAAVRRLEAMPAGGRTPLAEGLLCAAETLRLERIRDPRRRPLLVVVTDGRATFGADALRRSHQAAALLAASGVAALVLDCETGRFRMGLAAKLAETLLADYAPIGEIGAAAMTSAVAAHRGSTGQGRAA